MRTFITAVLIFFVGTAFGAEMNTQQKNTLRAAILAEPALAAALAVRDDNTIANYCNAAASPVQKVWTTSYTGKELFEATLLTEYTVRTAGERQALDLMISMGTVDPSKAKIRAAIADIFSGATNSTSRAAILTDMTRNATWAEQKLGGSDVATSGVTAWKLNWGGAVTPFEISTLLNQ